MKLKLMIATALAGGMALAGTPSHAAVIVAGPGAAVSPAGYPQAAAVTRAGTEVTFVNLDPLAAHNVVAIAKKPGTNQPLFKSTLIAAGETAAVTGTGALAPGDYAYKCDPHPNMTGTLKVV